MFLIGKESEHSDVRTGEIVSIKKEAFLNIFNAELPKQGIAYCEPEVIKQLQLMMESIDD